MTSGFRRSGFSGVSLRNARLFQAGPALRREAPSVLAIGLESCSSRDGGLNRYFAQLVSSLGQLGTPITALVTGEVRPEDDEVVDIVGPITSPLTTRLRAIFSGIKRHSDADIVDAHFALTALPVLFGRLRHRPLVVHFQGPWADESAFGGEGRLTCALKRRLERFVYRRADILVVLSRAFRRVLVERYGISPWNIHVIPPGVDTESFSPGDRSEARAALSLPLDAFLAIAVRRLEPRMGLDVLLEAWAGLLRSAETPIMLCIVGTGPHLAALKQRCADLGLEHVVRFAGRVDDEDLVRFYQAADVSIVPSVAFEGFGLVVLESLATGTPVMASGLDGLCDALEGFAPNLLLPPGEPEPLTERLKGALTGVDPLPTAEACRQYAESFSWTEVARRHRELYSHMTGQVTRGQNATQRNLRVVFLGHTAELSGGELALHRVTSVMARIQKHAILAQDGPLVGLLECDGVSVEILPMNERARDLRRDRVQWGGLPIVASAQSALYVLRLALRIARLQPDVVHTNTLKSALYGGTAARLVRIPCVWHIRDRIAPDYLPSSAVHLVHLAARVLMPDAVIINSRATLETMPRLAGARMHLIHDAAPAASSRSIASPRTERAPSFEQTASFQVAMVGRLASWKGQDVFLRAFAKAFPDGEELAVLVGSAFFGEDHFERQLRELVDDLGIEARVEFRGFRSKVSDELARVDVLVHASIIPEPFGQVVLEGMAAGLPVVAARAGGPAEIIVEGKTGLLYPPGDVDALSILLSQLAADPELRSRLGNQAQKAVTNYSPERVADQILDVYERLLLRNTSLDCNPSKRWSVARRRDRNAR